MTQTATPATRSFDLVTRGAGRATHIPGSQKHTTACFNDWNMARGSVFTQKAGKGEPTCKTCRKLYGLDK